VDGHYIALRDEILGHRAERKGSVIVTDHLLVGCQGETGSALTPSLEKVHGCAG
jgi:hypothetical protein